MGQIIGHIKGVVSCCIDGGEAHSVSGQTTDKQLRPPEEQTIVLVPLVAKSISYNNPSQIR